MSDTRRFRNRVTGRLVDGRRFVTEHRVKTITDSLGNRRFAAAYGLAYENKAGTDWIRPAEMVGFGFTSKDLATADMERSIAGLTKDELREIIFGGDEV